jgi:hypothetical protein
LKRKYLRMYFINCDGMGKLIYHRTPENTEIRNLRHFKTRRIKQREQRMEGVCLKSNWCQITRV